MDDTDPEEIDKVFDAFEDLGVDLNDDIEEPDIEDLENQETIAYIEPKLYPFNPNIGDYGGFRLELTPYTEQ